MNFLSDIWSKLVGVNQLYSIEVVLGDTQVFHLTELKIEKGEVSLSRCSVANDLSSLNLNAEIPLVLTFNGKGILSRMDDSELFSDFFPTLKKEEVYLHSEGVTPSFSIIRKEILDNELSAFDDFNLLGLYLGEVNSSTFNNHIKRGERSFFDSQELENTYLNSYCGAIAYLTQFNGVDEFADIGQEFLAKKKFKTFGVTFLVVLLISLLVNALVFDSYRKEFTQLKRNSNDVLQAKQKLAGITEELNKKRDFINNEGWSSPYYLTHKADDLGFSVPKSVQLISLEINPEDIKQTRKQGRSVFNYGSCQIEGKTKSSVSLNSWVKEIESMDWVEEVEILSYKYLENTSEGQFVIKVVNL